MGLERYQAILDGRAHPRYMHCRSVNVELQGDETLEALWKVHEVKLGEYKELVEGGAHPKIRAESLLGLKVRMAGELLKECCICERRCGVDRTAGKSGKCGVLGPRVASDFVHYGEEEPLVPSYTVFFAGCNFQCAFCQNYDISTNPHCGRELTAKEMASRIERMAEMSSSTAIPTYNRLGRIRNVNWVGGDPTPNLPFVLEVLDGSQVNIAQVWNSNMYLSEESMALLDGAVDIYLTDFKYGNDGCASRLSGVKNYMRVTSRNHLLAAAQCEVIVRHLMLPDHLECCTLPVLDWLSENVPEVTVNIMDQYHPEHRAMEYPELRRHVSNREYCQAVEHAQQNGIQLI